MVQHVRSYVKRDGTRVKAHTRDAPGKRAKKTRSNSGRSSWTTAPAPRANSASWSSKYAQEMRKKMLDDKKVHEAAAFCADIIKSGAIDATVDRVAKYVTDETWRKLSRKWKVSRCEWLNALAKAALNAKSRYHELTAELIVKLLSPTLRHKTEQQFAKELAKSIPLPGDAKFVAVAHGLRIVGVGLCIAQDLAPEKCACFESLVLEYGKEATKKLLIAEGDTWMNKTPGSR